MTVEIKDGWLYGTLPDDKGHEWPIERHIQFSTGAEHANPNLVLHTTETDHIVDTLRYPSNFQTGDGKIVQHIRLGESGDSVWTYDRDTIDVEMVAHSKLAKWLPGELTLGPTIALVAWLHKTGRIRSGLVRPYDYPVLLDRLPAAVSDYYRRRDPRDQPGVYGHVELDGGNTHWDPGSFDYPVFLARVKAAVDGPPAEDPLAFLTEEQQKDLARFLETLKATLGTKDDPNRPASAYGAAVRVATATRKVEDQDGAAVPPHQHDVTGTAA